MKKILLSAVVLTIFYTPADAIEFEINHSVYNYDITNTKVEPDSGSSSETKTTEIHSFEKDLEIGIQMGRYNVYATPLNPGSSFAFGYNISRDLEVGAIFGYQSSTSDPEGDDKSEESSTTVGVFAEQTLRIDRGLDLEIAGAVAHSQGKIKSTSSSTTTKSNTTTNALVFGADIVKSFHEHFAYVCGASYRIRSSKEKEANTKSESSTLSLNLAAFRYTF